jgi:hypothetical protein
MINSKAKELLRKINDVGKIFFIKNEQLMVYYL